MSTQNDVLHNFGAATNKEVPVTTSNSYLSTTATEATPAFLMLQNVGTVPVFYRLSANAASSGDYCTTADQKYSGILAAGSADYDGTGGVMTLAGYTGGLAFTVASGSGKVNIAYSGRMGD
tara:strand:+ start:1246 stop:1608 length:363 start_codon:yes stop_codon:yes gene_type:complete